MIITAKGAKGIAFGDIKGLFTMKLLKVMKKSGKKEMEKSWRGSVLAMLGGTTISDVFPLF